MESRIKRWSESLSKWNYKVFGNINMLLREKRQKLENLQSHY